MARPGWAPGTYRRPGARGCATHFAARADLRSQACIGGEKRLDSVQPSKCMGNCSAMRE